jgi:hypothetical protein
MAPYNANMGRVYAWFAELTGPSRPSKAGYLEAARVRYDCKRHIIRRVKHMPTAVYRNESKGSAIVSVNPSIHGDLQPILLENARAI